MALNSANVTFPNAKNSVDTTQADKMALVIEEFTGMVEGTINRRSVLADHIPVRAVKGTATFTNHAVGKSTLQKVVPGTAPDGIKSDFSKNSVTVDTVIAAREFFPMLDVFQTQMDTRREVAGEQGKEIEGPGSGVLAIKASWPSQIRSIYGDHQRLIDTYFKPYPGYYFSGDGARRDEDGYYWITGRVDDVINVSGHRIGTAEVESALVLHDAVAEAAVVGYPHDLKGQGIYAFVTPMNDIEPSAELQGELLALVGKEIGSFAKPELLQWAPGLPKTRSGKIMRRILRKIACNELDSLGDTSTLADPTVVDGLIDKRLNR